MSSRVRVFVVALALAVFMAVPLSAQAYVIPFTVDQMAGLADTVVEVRVSSAGSRWTHDPRTRERRTIMTDVRVHVVRTLKGELPADFTFSQPGGTVGSDGLVVSDLSTFTPGERCILFLDANGVIGGAQGKLEVIGGRVPAMGVSLAEARTRICAAVTAAPPAGVTLFDEVIVPLLAADSSASLIDGVVQPSGITIMATTMVFESTFEGGSTAGWSMTGSPTWATTTYRASDGSYSLYGSGGGSGSVPAPGPCPLTVSANAQRVMDLSAYNIATLEWDVCPSMTDSSSNWMNVALATSASGPWYYPSGTFAQGAAGTWGHYSVDLRSVTDQFGAGTMDFTGRAIVYVRLVFIHSVGSTDEGVYVDNVGVTADTTSPEIVSISPSFANAGIGEQITITGTDLGASQGSGSVTFLRGDAQDGSRVSGSVVSWSDTQIVCEVPRLAESGGVIVNTDSGVSSVGYVYTVGFSDSGMRWASPTVTYYINENTTDLTGEGAAIQRAFATWSDCGSQFSLAYGGTCSTVDYPPPRDSSFDIYFVSSGFPSGVLALYYYWLSDTTTTTVESDIVFNDNYAWADGAVLGRYDVETIALHELGHTVGLDDQYGDMDEAMGAGSSNSTRRDLSSYDTAGAIYIWGAIADTTPPGAPTVSSSTHPSQSTWYDDPDPAFSFSASDPSGITGYSYTLDALAVTTPDQVVDGAGPGVSYTGIADGEWYFHVRAVDGAGNWGAASHYRVRIDTSPLEVVPVEGVSRFETAVEASKLAFPSPGSADCVVIATGLNWPDALGGAALAGAKGAPILLSTASDVPTTTMDEIARLGATEAIILGGTGAVGLTAEAELKGALGAGNVTRIGGINRYETAQMVAQATIDELGGTWDGTAFLATGSNFPDALAAAPIAAAKGWPIYLTPTDAVGEAKAAMHVDTDSVLILGGTGAVSKAVEDDLKVTFGDLAVERLAGVNRYATAV
ncbi:MAG: cell wall-binding repeat-containing protein, partial [Coriobacteriia bacterium]|nr:cell wall-binding repeat-containing protein [Coriobacteriia bacterium]